MNLETIKKVRGALLTPDQVKGRPPLAMIKYLRGQEGRFVFFDGNLANHDEVAKVQEMDVVSAGFLQLYNGGVAVGLLGSESLGIGPRDEDQVFVERILGLPRVRPLGNI